MRSLSPSIPRPAKTRASPDIPSRIWVAHADCARIIGRQGETRKDIERQSGASLTVQKEEEMLPGESQRFVELFGSADQRQKAIELIQQITSDVPDGDGEGKDVTSEVVLIRFDEVGRIIGRGGENIRRIELESGARLQLNRSAGQLFIKGSSGAVGRAKEMVQEEVAEGRTGDGAVDEDASGGPAPALGPALRLWVYSKEAGRIIGRGGETVREIIQRTGAEVQIERGEGKDHSTERMIQIFGTKPQREEAAALIIADLSYARGDAGIIKTSDVPREECMRRASERESSMWGAQLAPSMVPGVPVMGMPGMPGMPGMMGQKGMMPMCGMPGMRPQMRKRGTSSSSSSSSSSNRTRPAFPGFGFSALAWRPSAKPINWDEL